MKDFGILLFGFTRPLFIADVLMSLEKQNALKYVDVWLDGHQGNAMLKTKNDQVYEIVHKFKVANIYRHNGNLGFRKLMLQALSASTNQFDKMMILEDDCFPTKQAVEIFLSQLEEIKKTPEIFSVYGHHFLSNAEQDVCTRFQGWGWGTTSEKLKPILRKLIECYSYTENEYLNYVNSVLTEDILKRIDVTPPRLPTATLRKFFAWDETVTLLTALAGMVHKKTNPRTIYNFGASPDSTRFRHISQYLDPPFNMIPHEKVWDFY